MNRGIEIQPGDAPGLFRISGMIDAHLDISPLLESPSPTLVLNLKGIKDINSIGIKQWVESVQTLKNAGKSVVYQECSPAFVRQCNFVNELSIGIEVRSLDVIFECEECDEFVTKTIETQGLDLDNLPPDIPCPECNDLMQTEDLVVFDFLKK